MLRFVLDVLLLRNLIQSRLARVALLVFFIGALIAGVIYAWVVFQAVTERSHLSNVPAYHSH